MRTFEFSDGKSNKFWKIELAGKAFTVTYGRIGTDGQNQTKEFPSEEKAKAAHDKLVAEKLAKGYVETTAGKASATPSSGKALENAIFANPDDLGAHAAYADWLIEQGDPRGEFIQVQLALEDEKKPAAERKELEKREKELLKKHEKEWLGDLAEAEELRWHFSRGWLDQISTSNLNVSLSRSLAKTTIARVVQQLRIEGTAYEEAGEYEEGDDIPEDAEEGCLALYPLLKSSILGNVRVFQLGELEDSEYPTCHTSGNVAIDLVKRMPRIEELYLMAHRVDNKTLFGLKTLTNLRVLRVDHVHDYPFQVLAKNPTVERLATLLCHPHALEPDENGAYINLAGVKALVHSPHLKSLTHLRLRLSDMGDKGCKEIVDSGVLKRLKVLELRGGCITDAGANMLADCPDLKRLDLLDVSKNRLTKSGIDALLATKVKILAQDQRKPDEDDEYPEYLAEGDWE